MLHRDLFPDRLLRAEMAQRREEGCDPGDLANQIEAAIATGSIDTQADAFWAELEALLPCPSGREEPSQLETIQAARPAGPRRYTLDLSEAALAKRVYGAWLGRCAGCTLGKPVEGWPRAKIEAYLRAADAYPLSSYFPVLDPFPEGLALRDDYQRAARGHIEGMTRDDDIDYTVLGLHVLETYGRDFSSRDVAIAWISSLPFHMVYTAEAVAYRNLVNGLEPPHTARHRNPYREWIGAQIRADMWGYVNPGNPERAAEFAYRDASLSHTANGIYGAMWVAACLAAAFTTDDMRQVIAAGLAEIPTDCRLAEAVRDTVLWADQGLTWEDAWERVNARYGGYHRVHVINNTCLIVLGLLYGEADLRKSVCLAVMGGWDTDCTGATVGSIVGAMRGATALPEDWIGPLNDRLESIVPGFHDSRISDLAQRTLAFVDVPAR